MKVERDNYGMQKSARLAALRREKAEEKEAVPLEPSFPWVALGFPYGFFGAMRSDEVGEKEKS
jgi:hypothetical protein